MRFTDEIDEEMPEVTEAMFYPETPPWRRR
jgi:hypothetical protein